tara:strand:+ start:1492 stop:2205 length:714 start_codon:yes stop_codon:yes gene_type:complete
MMALLWVYRNTFKLIMLTGLFLSGCGSNQVIVQGDFPTPLIEKLNQTLGVYYEDEFKSHEIFDEARSKGQADWQIRTGEAQVRLWNLIFSGVFSKTLTLSERPSSEKPADGVDVIIIPHVEELQYAIPSHTQVKVYEIWMRYRFELINAAGEPLGDWKMTAYGKTPQNLVMGIEGGQSKEEAINLAAIMALRDAGAHFVTSFRRAEPIALWLDGLSAREDDPNERKFSQPESIELNQ